MWSAGSAYSGFGSCGPVDSGAALAGRQCAGAIAAAQAQWLWRRRNGCGAGTWLWRMRLAVLLHVGSFWARGSNPRFVHW